jgi:hypothetical protein
VKHPEASEEWLALQAEKAVFLSAFIIRKLMDSNRLAPALAELPVPVDVVDRQRPGAVLPIYLSWRDADEYYDFDTNLHRKLPLRSLVNRLIHSYAFLVVGAYDGDATDPSAFFFNSDKTSGELFHVQWEEYKLAVQLVRRGTIS